MVDVILQREIWMSNSLNQCKPGPWSRQKVPGRIEGIQRLDDLADPGGPGHVGRGAKIVDQGSGLGLLRYVVESSSNQAGQPATAELRGDAQTACHPLAEFIDAAGGGVPATIHPRRRPP